MANMCTLIWSVTACVSLVKWWTGPVVSVKTFTVKFVKLKIECPSLSRIGGRFIPTIFRPISRPTAGQSEGCYPWENIGPGGNVSPLLLDYSLGADRRKGARKKYFLYTLAVVNSCFVIYCMMYTFRVTYHLAFTTNESEKKCQHKKKKKISERNTTGWF